MLRAQFREPDQYHTVDVKGYINSLSADVWLRILSQGSAAKLSFGRNSMLGQYRADFENLAPSNSPTWSRLQSAAWVPRIFAIMLAKQNDTESISLFLSFSNCISKSPYYPTKNDIQFRVCSYTTRFHAIPHERSHHATFSRDRAEDFVRT